MRSTLGLLLVCLPLASLQAEDKPRTDPLGDLLPAHAVARIGTTRWGKPWWRGTLSYMADGKLLGVGQVADSVGLWDIASAKRLHHWQGANQASRDRFMTLSADGRVLAVIDNDQDSTIQTFEAGSGKARATWTTPERDYQLALSPDGKLLATSNYEQNVRLWDTATGKELRLFKRAGRAVVFTRDGKTLLIGSDKRVRIWDLATGKEVRRLEGPATLLALSADGKVLAVMGAEGLRLWDPTTGKELRTIEAVLDEYSSLAISADGRTVAFANDETLSAWDTATGRERVRRRGLFRYGSIALSPDGQTLAWTDSSKVRRWDLTGGRELLPCPGHQSTVFSLAFSPNGERLVSRGADNVIHVWKLGGRQPEPVRSLRGDERNYIVGWKVVLSPDGKLMATPGWEHVRLLDAETGKELRLLPARNANALTLAFSPDGKFLAGGDTDNRRGEARGRVRLWEVASGKLVRTIEDLGTYLHELAFSPDGKTLALGSDAVRLWDVASAEQVRRIPTKASQLLFSPDGRTLIASGDGVTLWDVKTGNQIRRLNVSGPDPALALSSDGKVLATSGDSTLRLWDAATGAELMQFPGHSDFVTVLAFSPDGKWLTSGSNDTTILLWDVKAALTAARLKGKVVPEPINLEPLWVGLAKADAAAAHKAIWAFVAEPDRTIAFLNKHLQPLKEEDAGDLVVPAGEPLRMVRAIEILERIRTPEARGLLEKLSKGPASRASRDARAALLRLDQLDRVPIAPRPEPGRAELLEQWWKELGEPSGHHAVWSLIREPEQAVALLKARLQPAREKEAGRASPVLVPAGDALRGVRAIMVLERIGTTQARAVLAALSKGAPARITEDARAALERLDQRTGGKP